MDFNCLEPTFMKGFKNGLRLEVNKNKLKKRKIEDVLTERVEGTYKC